MQFRHLIFLPMIPLLAACGGSGDTSLGGAVLPGPAGFDALLLEVEALDAKSDAPGFGPSETLPTEDGLGYDGVMAVAANFDTADEAYLGDFTATVNFAAGNLTGTGSGFFFSSLDSEGDPDAPGTPVAGEITVNSINVGLEGFDVALIGTLLVNGQERTIDSGAGIAGFGGANGDVLAGVGSIDFDLIDTTLDVLFLTTDAAHLVARKSGKPGMMQTSGPGGLRVAACRV